MLTCLYVGPGSIGAMRRRGNSQGLKRLDVCDSVWSCVWHASYNIVVRAVEVLFCFVFLVCGSLMYLVFSMQPNLALNSDPCPF